MEPATKLSKNGSDCRKANPEHPSERESSVESFRTVKSERSSTAETELIDVDDIELSDEESWLYKSPKKVPTPADKILTTCMWVCEGPDSLDDAELQKTNNALLTKLTHSQKTTVELSSCKTSAKDVENSIGLTPCPNAVVIPDETSDSTRNKENEMLGVSDVQKIAKLQEESLRQSTSRFVIQAEKKLYDRRFPPLSSPILSKPASDEALNLCCGKYNADLSLAQKHKIANHCIFNSSSYMNDKTDVHRSSLPDMNPGYFSLRSKKSKKQNELKMSCPLPIYPQPKLPIRSSNVSSLVSPTHLNSYRTLPSSYRFQSRSNSLSSRNLPSPPSPLSNPMSPTHRIPMDRRESAPDNNSLRYLSSPSLHRRRDALSPVMHVKVPSTSSSKMTRIAKPLGDMHCSPSPSRRFPFSTMHNKSPKRGNSNLIRSQREDSRNLASLLKTPSPSSRSGIPVPSHISRANDDDSWSQDCF